MNKRTRSMVGCLATLAFVGTLVAVAPVLGADIQKPEDFPTSKIEWNLWYGPGGGTDIFARTIGIPARRYLKPAPLVIVNIPGAAGANGMIYTMEQPADGYTITSIGNDLPINVVQERAKFDGRPLTIDDFEPIIRCQYDTATLQVNPNKCKSRGEPFKDVEDLVDFAKKNPNSLIIGITGSAGVDEVVTSMWLDAAGITAKLVPYDSAGKCHAALLGGHVDVMFEEFGPTVSLLEQGQLKALLVFKENRVEDSRFADVPCSVEKGWDVTLGRWRGIGAKKGTPADRIEYLHQVFKKSMEHPVYKNLEKANLLDIRPGYMGPEDLKIEIRKERDMFEKVLKKLGYIK
ncbi:MAG TPA: tripartite tricarboxylate transporter substrate binding protein [Desulfobacteraceae bacterium]|nr:tripartite tricarboxylate transporter substrate binding protein [Desulfobacteraceae bacterium]